MTIHVDAIGNNRTVRFFEDEYPKEELDEIWRYRHPKWHVIQSRYRSYDPDSGKTVYTWDGYIRFLKHDRVPAGLFYATREEVERQLGIGFSVEWHRKVLPTQAGQRSDRVYQNDCVDRMLESIKTGGGLVLNATGTGKTRIAGMFCASVRDSVIFVVDQLDLLEQTRVEFKSTLGEKIGYVGNQKYQPERVTVATVQTIARHLKDKKFAYWFSRIKLHLIDELHVQLNKSNFDSVWRINPLAVFGMTATLELKKKDVRLRSYALCGPVIYEYPLHQGVAEGVLTNGVVIRVLYPNHI